MSFDGRTFLTLAEELTNTTDDMPVLLEEAHLRSAISRAYYAAFWRARA